MFYIFVSNAPVWVWPLLLGLLVLGLRQTLTQQMGWARVTVLPLALVGLSVYGTLSVAARHPAALLLWAVWRWPLPPWCCAAPCPPAPAMTWHYSASPCRAAQSPWR